MNHLTGSLEEFSLMTCEGLSMPIRQAACYGYKTGFSCATQILIGAFAECSATGEFDIQKFSRMIRPFIEDLGTHATP